MRTFKNLILAVTILATTFVSCTDKEVVKPEKVYKKVAYVVNYGNYSGSKSEISIYDETNTSISHDAYKTANSVDFTSSIQSMAIHNDIAYFMSNDGDKLDIVDAKTLEASVNPISTDITKPRYFVADGNTAYVSCWGDVVDWAVLANSYIAKIDLTSKAVTKIALAGGPEGVILKNNKLYVALSTVNEVAVIDLATNDISRITVSAVPQHFVEDGEGNLWVSLVSKYSTPFPAEKLGLEVINTQDNSVSSKVDFPQMGGNGLIQISADKKTIYTLGSEAWPGTATSIYSVNVADKTLSSTALITGEKFNGFNVNPTNDNIYLLISPSATEAGTLKIYDKNGTLVDEEATGIAPQAVVFYDIEQ